MPRYFVFNGDADGICASQQLLLADSKKTEFITGVKREISLLKRIDDVENTQITVLNITIEKNLKSLKRLLRNRCTIEWFDHHISDEIPSSQYFECFNNTDPDTNTSQIVNKHLNIVNFI